MGDIRDGSALAVGTGGLEPHILPEKTCQGERDTQPELARFEQHPQNFSEKERNSGSQRSARVSKYAVIQLGISLPLNLRDLPSP